MRFSCGRSDGGLKPYVDRGDIKIVADPFAKEWQPNEAMKHTENALTQNE